MKKKKSKTIKMRCLICRKLTLSLKTRKHMCMCIMKKIQIIITFCLVQNKPTGKKTMRKVNFRNIKSLKLLPLTAKPAKCHDFAM